MIEPRTKDEILKSFMQENFPYDEFKKIWLFKGIKRHDYAAQAAKVCWYFGYESVYEYGARAIHCHITFGSDNSGCGYDRPFHVNKDGELKPEPFITVIPSLFD